MTDSEFTLVELVVATRWASGSARPQPPHQLPRIRLERRRQLDDVVQGQVALAAFDLADEGPVQTGDVGQSLLAVAQFGPAGSHPRTELAGDR